MHSKAKHFVGLAVCLSASLCFSQDDTLRELWHETREGSKRFREGYQKGKGHAGDKMIEGLIEYATPEADESTRKVQRDAVKFMVDPSPSRSEKHLDNMLDHTREAVEGTPSSSTRSSHNRGRTHPVVLKTVRCSALSAAGQTQAWQRRVQHLRKGTLAEIRRVPASW